MANVPFRIECHTKTGSVVTAHFVGSATELVFDGKVYRGDGLALLMMRPESGSDVQNDRNCHTPSRNHVVLPMIRLSLEA